MPHRYAIVALGLAAGCTNESIDGSSGDILGNAIREAGFACEALVSSEAIGETGDTWRVACADAQVYLASVEANGDVCFEPVRVVDPPGRQVDFTDPLPNGQVQSPEARCVAGVTL